MIDPFETVLERLRRMPPDRDDALASEPKAPPRPTLTGYKGMPAGVFGDFPVFYCDDRGDWRNVLTDELWEGPRHDG